MKKIRRFLANLPQKGATFFARHKLLSILGLVLVVVLVATGLMKGLRPDAGIQVTKNQVVTLKHKDVTNAVNETGTVVSSTVVDVYAQKQSPIVALHVKVGDRVEKGDLIAELDSQDIRQQIAEKQASAAAQAKTLGAQISAAKNRLYEAVTGKKNGTNPGVQGANSSLVASFDAYKQAQKVYEDYKRSLDQGYNPELLAEKSERDSLAYQETSSNVKYSQLRDDLAQSSQRAMDSRSRAGSLDGQIAGLKNQLDSLNQQVIQTTREISQKNRDLEKASGANPPAGTPNNGHGSNHSRVEGLQKDLDDLNERQEKTRLEISQVTEDLAKLQGDREKYLAEAEAMDKEVEAMAKTIPNAQIELEKARSDAQLSADKEVKNKKAREDQLKTYKQNMEVAKNAYDQALKALEGARVAQDNDIANLKDSLQQAQAGKNNVDQEELKFLKESLDQTLVKAPASGTITQLKAKLGETPAEALARVETVNTLRVESHIKEYNINDVHVGTKVVLTSDAVEGKEFMGEVVSVSPGPEEKAEGAPSKDVYYKTVIDIKGGQESLLAPGMNVRVKYILSQEKNTFSVPTDAIYERDKNHYILSLKDLGKNRYELVSLPVTVGLSNDFESSITGPALKEKMKVLTSSQGYGQGQVVTIIEAPEEGQDG